MWTSQQKERLQDQWGQEQQKEAGVQEPVRRCKTQGYPGLPRNPEESRPVWATQHPELSRVLPSINSQEC